MGLLDAGAMIGDFGVGVMIECWRMLGVVNEGGECEVENLWVKVVGI